MTITARVHNHSIALPPDLSVAEGAEVQVTVPEPAVPAGEKPLAWMDEFVGCMKDLPEESAAPESPAPVTRRTLAERYAKFVGLADDMPTDLARNLDHYIHGQPRKP